MAGTNTNRYLAQRPMVLGLAKVLFIGLSQLPLIQAAPYHVAHIWKQEEEEPLPSGDLNLWLYLGVSAFLVLLGGAFAGLTIALMGQDEIYLQVIRDSGEGPEVKHAGSVLNLLHKGKHWVLVTLLLSNVITNETLPIVLDRSLGGGWPAVLGSTVLIVIFGEIVPQSICVRYGLPIGAWMSPFVIGLMYIMAPIAWPTAKLLDYLLGEDHGTVYKKAGLKTLVSLHRSMGDVGQRLHSDEVTIISAVLDLKEKPIGSIMTPMDDVFTLSLDDVLDEITMDDILSQGYSRIPVHHPDNDENFVGMLLVKMLITYDPEDAKPVRDFALATLPEARPDASCLDIVNFFQEGKSHMILVSDHPGEDHGALGVVTLEDVIEELIGEEIIDESDVFVDVHKAIRRMAPAPRTRFPKVTTTGATPRVSTAELMQIAEHTPLESKDLLYANGHDEAIKHFSQPNRRASSHSHGEGKNPKRPTVEDLKEHLKHLGPSNAASRPKSTRYTSVKIKPGSDAAVHTAQDLPTERTILNSRPHLPVSQYSGGIGEGILSSGGRPASDGVQAVAHGYGTLSGSPNDRRPQSANKGIQADEADTADDDNATLRPISPRTERTFRPTLTTTQSDDTIGQLPDRNVSKSPYFHSGPARSGSITENIIDTNGIRKVVLETTSSSSSADEDEEEISAGQNAAGKSGRTSNESNTTNSQANRSRDGNMNNESSNTSKKKKGRRRKKDNEGKSESDPLLG